MFLRKIIAATFGLLFNRQTPKVEEKAIQLPPLPLTVGARIKPNNPNQKPRKQRHSVIRAARKRQRMAKTHNRNLLLARR